ncbi:BTAD domain-containing putative transcriptional regulator [Amycolatopsis lurida]
MVRYTLLGVVGARRGTVPVRLGGRKQRTVLAMLLLESGHLVPLGRLFRALWGESLPKTARAQVHNHVSGLRKALGVRIHGGPEGYRLDTPPDEVDLAEFTGLVNSARAAIADGDDSRAVELLRSGLALWSQPVLGGVSENLRQMVVAGLLERRLTALCDRFDAEFRLARHEELVGELQLLASEHPLDDRFPSRLMLALYRMGRQADALLVYQDHRRIRRDDLGLDATPALRKLHRAILASDPALDMVPFAGRPAPSTVRIGVLGPVEVRGHGHLGGAQQRAVLAVLAVHAGETVPTDRLVSLLWSAEPPTAARATIHTYLSRLRKVIGPAVLVRSGSGYRFDGAPSMVDLHVFRATVNAARGTTDDAARRDLLTRALSLWRADPLPDTRGGAELNQLKAALAEERWTATEEWAEVAARLGDHQLVIETLMPPGGGPPTRERLVGALTAALVAVGRHDDAAAISGNTTVTEAGRQPVPGNAAAPRQLPNSPRLFTGRTDELSRLSKLLAVESDRQALGPVVLSGAGGIGKTCLALHWAHQNAHLFPGGQLYVNLRGFAPAGEPASSAQVLRGFLDALGVDRAAVPAGLDELAALYRSHVSGRRLLVVLDNARDTTQVKPLLPGHPACSVLVTSRNQLGALQVGGAHLLDLDVLPEADSRELLSRFLGHERAAAEPDAVAQLLRFCADLPLAISIVAERAGTHPEFPLAALAEELCDASARLDAMDTGEPSASLRAVFSWSRKALTPAAAAVFDLIGTTQGQDIGLSAATALTGLGIGRTRLLLRELETVHLVQQHRPGHYRMHDLVRLYAREQARRELPARERDEAMARLLS